MVIITAGVPILAWLQSLPWYVIALSAIGAFGLTLWAINQFAIFRERRSKGFAAQNNDKIEATLRRWLDKERFKIKSDPRENMHFQFKAEDDAGRAMTVARPKDIEEFIFIGGSWKIPPDLHPKFDEMPDEIREEMLEELKVEMLRLKVNYIGLKHPLRRVGVEVRVPCDEAFTQSLFLQQLQTARYAYILMTVLMEKALRRAGHDIDKAPSQQ